MRLCGFINSGFRMVSGWHICSSCQKASHYMCYTCTFSLCKGCIKGADYVCVRGNKGFCTTCLRTIMLIENTEQGNNETVCTTHNFGMFFNISWNCFSELCFSVLIGAFHYWNELKLDSSQLFLCFFSWFHSQHSTFAHWVLA